MNTPQFSVAPVHDPALEAAVLGRLMNERYTSMQILPLLDDSCFYSQNHLTLFRAIRQLETEGREITMLSVTDRLTDTLPRDQVTALMGNTASTVFASNEQMEPDVMALRLQDYARRRKIGLVCRKLMTLHSDMTYPLEQGIRESMALIESTLMGSTDSYVTLSQRLDELAQIIADNQDDKTRHEGLLCGLPQVDETGGLPSDGLVVVGAKSSHGKTSFATTLAVNALKGGKRVAFYSMEMSQQKVSGRILSMESGVSSNAIQRQKLADGDLRKVLDAIDALKASVSRQFYFDNRNVRDLDALVMSVRALNKQVSLDCVVIDYLQLMNESPGHRSENTNKLLGGIAHRLHEVAQDLGITIVLLSQINRNVSGEPTMGHLRDSGEIAEAADMVIILYNPAVEHATFPKPFEKIDPKGLIHVRVDKNRDGATQSFLMGFNATETRMYALDSTRSLPLLKDADGTGQWSS